MRIELGFDPHRSCQAWQPWLTKQQTIATHDSVRERAKMLTTILFIVLVLLLLGALPVWPYSRRWGYWPGGLLGFLLLILLIMWLLGIV
jgi:hypothetical protein